MRGVFVLSAQFGAVQCGGREGFCLYQNQQEYRYNLAMFDTTAEENSKVRLCGIIFRLQCKM